MLPSPAVQADAQPLPRPMWLPVFPAIATVLAGISWAADGVVALNDLSWVILTLACAVYCLMELKAFPRRMGVGGLVLYGGVIAWFSVDYFKYWSGYFGTGLDDNPMTPGGATTLVLSKTCFFHMLFITGMSIGMLIPKGKWLVRLIVNTPHPHKPQTLLGVIVALFVFGLLPYVFFNSEPLLMAIWHQMTALRAGTTYWTVGRSGGALNYSWGAYIVEWTWVGQFAGMLAAFYAIFMAKSGIAKVGCWIMWLYTLGIAFGTGTRGEMLYVCSPVAGMFFIKYQTWLRHWVAGHRLKSYLLAGAVVLGMHLMIQVQTRYRGVGFWAVEFSEVNFTDPRDNTMFSTSLFVFQNVPEYVTPFFERDFPGEGIIMAIPQAVFYFVTGPIPRAIWHSKPFNPAFEWGSLSRTGAESYAQTTTISTGLVGNWYALCGPIGMIEGALLWGWLLAVFDRALWLARWRPLILVLVLALDVSMFRTFRDPDYNLFYPLLIGISALWAINYVIPQNRGSAYA